MELLSPVGNYDNLIAAVQNGADAVYLGASAFNARAGAKNFSEEELKEAILYARKRGVAVHLTLNTLLYNNELEEALNVAKLAYEAGVSALIIQDVGLAIEIKKRFPDLPLHSSTQMTISNVYGVELMKKLGFSRVVLARELSLKEIQKIRQNTDIELECFGHGALCISYSGQCLFSSIVGGRSGNRGLCAGPCRLNYSLLKSGKNIENGFLLSPKDICTLEILPELIDSGIDSLKIEGRKKSYEYVSIVTSIYRKYIDLATDKTKEYKVEDEDLKALLQIYNRGGMGTGYLENRKNIVYPDKPNHLGVYIGKVKQIDLKHKKLTLDLTDKVELGDVISINDGTSYISEVVNGNVVGEIKNVRDIKVGDKVYKIVSNSLNKKQWEIYQKQVKKVQIFAKLYEDSENIYLELKNDKISSKTALKKENYNVSELDKSRILCQVQKTGNTIFHIKDVEIQVENLKLPVSKLNELRRQAIQEFEEKLEQSILRKYDEKIIIDFSTKPAKNVDKPKINLYLQKLDKSINYSELEYYEIYVQFKDLVESKMQFRDCIVVLPTIIDDSYEKFILENKQIFEQVKAIAISHISQVEFLQKWNIKKEIVADYSLNITNDLSENVLKELGITRFTISPELNKQQINNLSAELEKELVVYGRICLMTSKYCPIGKNGECKMACKNGNYELKDRRNFVFPILTDTVDCHTKIYNSKILSVAYSDINCNYVRIDISDENFNEIKNIIQTVKKGKKLNGKNYTNGSL